MSISERGSGSAPEIQRTAWKILVASSLSVVLVFINSSALTIALPDLSRDLRATPGQSTWFLLTYMLSTTALILVFGRVADLVGRRRLYIAGIGVFLAASLACGLAPDAWFLIVSRIVQGIGAASILTNTTALLTDAFPPRTLSLGLGLNASVAAVGQVLGPLVGGSVSEAFGWRWIFLLGIPLSVLGLIWSLRYIPRRGHVAHGERFDVAGSALSIAAIGALVIAVSLGSSVGWGSPFILASLFVAVVAAGLFVVVQRRAEHPLVDLGIFDDPATTTLYAAAALCSFSSYAVVLLCSLHYQAAAGLTALSAALAILPAPVGTMLAASVAGVLTRRLPPKLLSTVGMVFIAFGALLLAAVLRSGGAYAGVASALLLVGLGIGLFMTPNTTSLMARVPERRRGIANAVRAALQNGGYLFSTAAALAIATAGLDEAQRSATYSGTLYQGPAADVASFDSGVEVALVVFAAVAFFGALVSFLGPRGEVRERPLISTPLRPTRGTS